MLSQVQNLLCLWKGGRLQNTQGGEISVELRGNFWCYGLQCYWILLLNLLGVFHMPPTSLPFKGRCCITHPCFSGFRSGTCHIFKAEEVWVSRLNHLHRNGFLPLVLIKPRVKQPSWPPGPIHATNYQDTWSQLLIYLRYYMQEVAKALKGSHFLALSFENFSSPYPLCLDLAGLCIMAQNFKESHWLHQKIGIM